MTYPKFCQTIVAASYTAEQLRFDVPPTDELMALLERVGMERYERYVGWAIEQNRIDSRTHAERVASRRR